MGKRLWLFLIILGGLVPVTLAQDPVFSQFYAAPLHVNPAFAGITVAPRITLNYRNQWPSWPNAYVTYAAAYEQSLEKLNSGIGLTVLSDDAGGGIYKTNRVNAIYGYQVSVSRDFHVKFGLSAGFIQNRLDWDGLLFLDQIDPLYGPNDPEGNPNISEEQRPENPTKTLVDISAGLLAYGGRFYGGVAVHHLNRPDERLLEVNQNLAIGLPLRFTVHGGAEIPLPGAGGRNGPTFISPNLMFIQQGGFGQVNAGAYAGFGMVFGGVWYRHALSNSDAAILLVGFNYGVLRIGYSYDFTISGLANSRTGGSHEISLTINFEDSKELQRKRNRSRYNDCFKMFR